MGATRAPGTPPGLLLAAILAGILATGGACAPLSLPGDGAPPLWTDAVRCAGAAREAAVSDCWRVSLRPEVLQPGTEALRLPLPDTGPVVAQQAALDLQPAPGSLYWRGTMGRQATGSAAFTRVGSRVAGRVATADGRVYRLRQWPTGDFVVERLDPRALPRELPPPPLPPGLEPGPGSAPLAGHPQAPGPGPGPATGAGGDADSPCVLAPASTICVLVVYTQGAAGDTPGAEQALRDEVAHALNDSNAALALSGVGFQVLLAGLEKVNYTETLAWNPEHQLWFEDVYADLGKLQAWGDGPLDEVHCLRDQAHADLVVLVTNYRLAGSNSFWQFGAGHLGNDSFAPLAFAIVPRRLLVNAHYDFAHELGHLMGANHDGMSTGGFPPGPFCYSHGHIDPAPEPVPGSGEACPPWMTIMGQPGFCPGCATQLLWSSADPELAWCGRPLGNSDTEDNVRTLKATAGTVAGFR